MDWANGRLINRLCELLPGMSVAVFADKEMHAAYDLPIDSCHIFPLPFPHSYQGGLRNTLYVSRILRRIEKDHDVLIIQLPFVAIFSLLALRKPALFHVCANVMTAASNPVKYRGVRRLTAQAFAYAIHKVYRRIFSRAGSRVIVNGPELADIYKDFSPRMVISSSIMESEIMSASLLLPREEDTFNLIFVGRPSLEKGFDTLVAAIKLLEFDFTLHVVGFGEEEFKSLLPETYANSRIQHSRMIFHGYMSWSNELVALLRASHVMVVPSRSEATPRVILEAMSQGVAVIGSNIGGIPGIITPGESGLLFKSGSADDLSNKIKLLYNNECYRREIVVSALKMAHRHTVEEFAKNFGEEIASVSRKGL